MQTSRTSGTLARMILQLQTATAQKQVMWSGDTADLDIADLQQWCRDVSPSTPMATTGWWRLGRNIIGEVADPSQRNRMVKNWRDVGSTGWSGAPLIGRPMQAGMQRLLSPLVHAIRTILVWHSETVWETGEALIVNESNLVCHAEGNETLGRAQLEAVDSCNPGGVLLQLAGDEAFQLVEEHLDTTLEEQGGDWASKANRPFKVRLAIFDFNA